MSVAYQAKVSLRVIRAIHTSLKRTKMAANSDGHVTSLSGKSDLLDTGGHNTDQDCPNNVVSASSASGESYGEYSPKNTDFVEMLTAPPLVQNKHS